ncbi:LPS export ABC transporter permease LptG [Zoogloea ramigera]|jgi:lipopolysaccharide export system permease protein|uniref:LPS export ABC transporter permease LptG n=1 Tax=Zoogloea ramigera TaxID=350 RepID=A0A4Y4CY35_ZOORA|nr:LPS export ABC transporter permease LptG [Zoogloea ramigera]GEC96223.1 LPS export ABC transporter permease LptG [Zoogloea ramigera]
MIPVYVRYLSREIYAAVLLVLLAFLGLFAFFDLVNELDEVGKNGYMLYHAAVYVAMIMPGRVYELMPIAVLIGTLYALTTFARHSEITVLRASGLSTTRFLLALLGIGSVFVALTFIFGEYLAPPAERAAQQWRLAATRSMVSQELRTGLWVRDGRRFVNVRSVLPDTSLEGVRIYEFDERAALVSISEAKTGVHEGASEGWRLRNVEQTRFLGDHTDTRVLPDLVWKSELTPEVLSVLMVVPERMSVSTLYSYIRHLEENNQRTTRYEIALWKKLAYPFAALVMMGLALPFGYMQTRMGGVSLKVFSGIMIGVGFHLLNGLFSNLGVINGWVPAVAALTPSIVFLIAAMTMMWWVERR